MAGKLTSGQRAGLLFGGAVLAALLIVGKAEGVFEGWTDKAKPPKDTLPPVGVKVKARPKPLEPGEYEVHAKPIHVQTECDPLQPELLAPGVGCFSIDDSGKFYVIPLHKGDEIPTIDHTQIGISANLARVKIGSHYIISVLTPWLNNEKEHGRLATREADAGSVADFLWNDPVSAINSLFDVEGSDILSPGTALFAGAWIIAGGGTRVLPKIFPKLAVPAAGVALPGPTIGGVHIAGVTIRQLMWAVRAGAKPATVAELISVKNDITLEMYEEVYAKELTKKAGFAWEQSPEVLDSLGKLLESATNAFFRFLKHHTAIVGYFNREEVPLQDLPYGENPKTYRLFQILFLEILRYQRRDFSFDAEDADAAWFLPYLP